MTRYTIGDIARITGSSITGEPGSIIRQVCTDTRRIDLPAESLFVALKGPSHDGHRFLREAFHSGIRSFLVGKLPDSIDQFPDSTFIVADNTLTALQDLAAWHRNQFKGRLIAITGSNGKTIIKEWMAQLMQTSYHITKSPKSYNSQLGVPLSVLNISGDEQYAIMEAGISIPGEMASLQRILDPDIGLISNIGEAHQENFADLTAKTREKISLFRNCKKIFYCLDHELIDHELTLAAFPGQKYSWSRNKPADLLITGESIKGSACHLSGIFLTHEVKLTIPFTDPASVENLIHIWLFLHTIGFEQATLQAQVSKLEPIRMRLEQKAGINRCTLINDYYNSDILSLKIALDLLFQQTPQSHKTIILSDILQTGQSEETLYREISRLLEHRNIHRLIGIGPAICRNRQLFTQPILTWPSTAEFINQVNTDDFHDEAILLKGARSFAFEQISSILEARIHATTLEIRMNDVRFNLEQYRKIVGPEVRIMAMVKAFSYGSGGIEMAKFLAHERVDYLGVAFADEGIEIRRAGIKTPVMVMNPDFQQSDLIIDHHLEPEIYNWTGLNTFSKTLRNLGLSPYPVHLKLDTGMHRLGFDYRETEPLLNFLNNHPELYLKSVFSHLAASEDHENDDFTNLQIKRFSESSRYLTEKIGYPILRHILNSSGIERFTYAHFDMVRLGIGLYGLGNSLMNLKPITTLKTIISQIHDLPAGESVGYGRRTILEKPTRIGVIPIGYADGIDRRLGNGNYRMMVKGKPVSTIGNICMDMTIIDLNGTEANEGDEVVVFGPQNPVTDIADILQTIPYEVLTSISPRVKRIFQFD
ncbi:MAG: bifunctional UDP-N-acetylmuramoyl-tripeptide:D-alanyl-D-alanine ligase/alanine racemase [Porphyromonadaceae bacterium]|nr:MAG: bifunctional UDP-N-acetylmuramoyl-tripeptide:D-alanyl-D-alanine ligase/alanine racemase [Porphyromonadaceae bacterium]